MSKPLLSMWLLVTYRCFSIQKTSEKRADPWPAAADAVNVGTMLECTIQSEDPQIKYHQLPH